MTTNCSIWVNRLKSIYVLLANLLGFCWGYKDEVRLRKQNIDIYAVLFVFQHFTTFEPLTSRRITYVILAFWDLAFECNIVLAWLLTACLLSCWLFYERINDSKIQ